MEAMDSIRAEQELDPVIVQVSNWVRTKGKPKFKAIKDQGSTVKQYLRQFEKLTIQDGTICHIWKAAKRGKTVLRQVLPPGLRISALQGELEHQSLYTQDET
jgi:hypothetical protein